MLGIAIATLAMTADSERCVAEPVELVLGRAENEIVLKAQVLAGIFGDEHFNWDVDLQAGTISFTSATKIVTAPVQVIGTYNTIDSSFMWGWDHPSVTEPRSADARLAKAFGVRNLLPLFTTRIVTCSEEQAWKSTAVALYLAGAQGAYRGPSGSTLVFMTFGQMTISPVR